MAQKESGNVSYTDAFMYVIFILKYIWRIVARNKKNRKRNGLHVYCINNINILMIDIGMIKLKKSYGIC